MSVHDTNPFTEAQARAFAEREPSRGPGIFRTLLSLIAGSLGITIPLDTEKG
jgi:hypothetical protein